MSNRSPEAPLVLVNAVGLTGRWLRYAPRLSQLADRGWRVALDEVLPAVTCTAQATLLTGASPQEHGIVANGWWFSDTGEVRFWQQSNRLMQREPLYETLAQRAKERGWSRKRPESRSDVTEKQSSGFRVAKLFWWFNQGANVTFSVTPKPHYGCDGSKAFGITGNPEGLTTTLEQTLGAFPFASFWGPRSGLPATAWIANAAAEVLRREEPDLSLAYLPHLDYEPQRRGPSGCDMPKLVRELDDACAPLLDAAAAIGARVWVVSEYGHVDVSRPILINQTLRQAGLLTVRDGPFGEMLDTFASRAFAVCDHQLAHVYVNDPADIPRVRERLAGLSGISATAVGAERGDWGLDHARSGHIVALSAPDAWFAYPYWLDPAKAPDFARTVDIHRKPGFDPCELFVDPAIRFPMLHVGRRLIQKKLGFRTRFDLIPLDPHLVRGSHGLRAADAEDKPLLIGDGPAPGATSDKSGARILPMTSVRNLLLEALGLG